MGSPRFRFGREMDRHVSRRTFVKGLGMAGAGIGLGNLFGQFLAGALRNPSAADGQRGTLLLGFALTEALGIFSLLIALLLLFVV